MYIYFRKALKSLAMNVYFLYLANVVIVAFRWQELHHMGTRNFKLNKLISHYFRNNIVLILILKLL